MLRFLTAGESHGPELVAVVEGVPAGFEIDVTKINHDLARRQKGYGRGGRMLIEKDEVRPVSGIRFGRTIGSPVTFIIVNRDFKSWEKPMSADPRDRGEAKVVTRPRPGHADLAGVLKYNLEDIRDILERASARETTARVAIGAFAKQFLAPFGIDILGYVVSIGATVAKIPNQSSLAELRAATEESAVRVADAEAERAIIEEIDACKKTGDTLGGVVEVVATGIPVGLGSHVQWDRKLDGRLAQALMSIPAIKAVGIGLGPEAATRPGSRVHDEILPGGDAARATGLARPTNNAGGLEGGVTNGEDLRVSAYMKPISTLMKPLRSVDLATRTESPAAIERSDVCAVPAAAVVGEAMVAIVLADALLDRFGGDSIAGLDRAMAAADAAVRARFTGERTSAGE